MRRNKSKFIGLVIIIFAIYQLSTSLGFVINGLAAGLIAGILAIYGIGSYFQKDFFAGSYAIALGFILACQASPELRLLLPKEIPYWTFFWMSSLIGLGLQMIFGRKSFRKSIIINNRPYNSKYNSEDFEESFDTDYSSEYIDVVSNLGAATRYIYSPNLKEVNVSANLGSSSVYFQERNLSNDINIFVSCKMGNIELYIPKEWKIEENVSVSLGNIDMGYVSYPNDLEQSPYTVFISGDVSLGNIEIKYI